MRVRVRVPASTSNVGAGFDCFGMALSMALDVETRPADRLIVEADGADVALDRTNLVVATFLAHLPPGAGEPAIALRMRNGIPLARGLGSSASARVAGVALAEAYVHGAEKVDRARVADAACALEGHPDNATPAVYGGFCVSAGRAGFERIAMGGRSYVVVIPDVETKTSEARRALPESVTLGDAVYNLQRAALTVARLARTGDLADASPFEDRLHQRYRLALETRVEATFAAIERMRGVKGVFLSGSGPAIFVVPEAGVDIAQEAIDAAKRAGIVARVEQVCVDDAGLVVCSY